MARPRKNPDDPKWQQNMAQPSHESSPTERVHAPVTEIKVEPVQTPVYRPTQARQKRIERQGAFNVPYVKRYPQVRAGTCEFCGTLDPTQPAEYQYKLCPHYRGMQLVCSYCPSSKDPDQVIGHSIINVYDHPSNPDELVVVCNSTECVKAHRERFEKALA